MSFQIRQGDVLVVSTDKEKPEGAELVPQDNGRVVLAYGEVTGHAHAFAGGKHVNLFRAGDDVGALVGFLKIDNMPAVLRHEEHTEHIVQPGKYKVIQQRQWTLAKQVSRVAD